MKFSILPQPAGLLELLLFFMQAVFNGKNSTDAVFFFFVVVFLFVCLFFCFVF